MKQVALGAVVAFTFGACVPPRSYRLSTTQQIATTPKPASCDFRVVNLPPQGDFEEIATLDFVYDPAHNPDEFKQAVHDKVCSVGGDVVVSEINGNGLYVRGTILRARAS